MILHPELRALRSDDAPQRSAQDHMHRALEDWRKLPLVAPVLTGVTIYAQGAPLEDCAALHALYTEANVIRAGKFAKSFVTSHLDALASSPLGHPAMRHFTDGSVSTLLLAQAGSVTLTMVAMDGAVHAKQPEPATVSFTPIDSTEIILAGSATAELVVRRPSRSQEGGALSDHQLTRKELSLQPGKVFRRDGSAEVLTIRRIQGCLVSLRLQRRKPGRELARQCDLQTGKAVHQSSGNPQDSRTEILFALLGRMGRKDAALAMARVARGQAGTSLRWQALRECLALDTAIGFSALGDVADSPGDPLMRDAASLRDELIRVHPVLATIPHQPGLASCPA